jgi:hypothetical protein
MSPFGAKRHAPVAFSRPVALLTKLDGQFAAGTQFYSGTATVRYVW